jgi:hypothetical protein
LGDVAHTLQQLASKGLLHVIQSNASPPAHALVASLACSLALVRPRRVRALTDCVIEF